MEYVLLPRRPHLASTPPPRFLIRATGAPPGGALLGPYSRAFGAAQISTSVVPPERVALATVSHPVQEIAARAASICAGVIAPTPTATGLHPAIAPPPATTKSAVIRRIVEMFTRPP